MPRKPFRSPPAALSDDEAGYIIRKGKLVYQWGDPTTKFEMKSTTKSMGGLGAAARPR